MPFPASTHAWDIIGQGAGRAVWRLLAAMPSRASRAYCTGNDIEQHVAFGYKRLKVAMRPDPFVRGRQARRMSNWWRAPAKRSAPTAM